MWNRYFNEIQIEFDFEFEFEFVLFLFRVSILERLKSEIVRLPLKQK